MFVLLLALLVGFHVASLELSSEFLSPTCPFVDSRDRENEWNFGSLLETVKAQAEQKLTERERCLANYNQLVNNLSTIKNLYAFENNPVLRQQIERDVLVRELTDLKLELVDLELKGQQNSFQYDSLFSESLVLKDALRRNEMDLKYSGPEFDKNKENFFKSEALQHVNNIVSTLSTLDASCVEHIGGWGQVIPSLLSVAGMAVGATGFGQSALLGSALTIASNISILFQNHDIKKAINEVDKQKNMKVLACTYHSIKFAACDYARAYRFSRDTQKILDLMQQKYAEGLLGEYELYFSLFQGRNDMADLFEDVARMGSGFTMPLGQLHSYYAAKQITGLDEIDINIAERFLSEAPGQKPSEDEINRWLFDVRRQGINSPVQNFQTGGIRTLKEQVIDAVNDIKNHRDNIKVTEAILVETRSFEDLRNRLDHKFSNRRELLTLYVSFLNKMFLDANFPSFAKGALATMFNIFEKLEVYLNVTINGDYNIYINELNKAGKDFFEAMARGTVSQVAAQSVLSIGAKVAGKLDSALGVVENYYLDLDLKNKDNPDYPFFGEFMSEQALQLKVVRNYELFIGTNVAFRLEEAETAMSVYTDVFEDEILEMMEKSMGATSEILADLKGKTPAQLCALFNDFLRKSSSSKAQKQLQFCRENYPDLEVSYLLDKNRTPIDYEDPCFFSEYVRKERTSRLLLDRFRAQGLKEGVRSMIEKMAPLRHQQKKSTSLEKTGDVMPSQSLIKPTPKISPPTNLLERRDP